MLGHGSTTDGQPGRGSLSVDDILRVMGRHVALYARGRLFRVLVGAAVCALVAVAGWYVLVHPEGLRAAGQCPTTLTVVTASSFAPVVATAGRAIRGGANCVQVDVRI